MKNPPHPGDFIRTEIIDPAGLSVTDAAKALHVSRPALSSLLNSKADLSGDMALRIEKAFGVKMDTLMRMQSSYDIAKTRKREKDIRVRRIRQPAAIPYSLRCAKGPLCNRRRGPLEPFSAAVTPRFRCPNTANAWMAAPLCRTRAASITGSRDSFQEILM